MLLSAALLSALSLSPHPASAADLSATKFVSSSEISYNSLYDPDTPPWNGSIAGIQTVFFWDAYTYICRAKVEEGLLTRLTWRGLDPREIPTVYHMAEFGDCSEETYLNRFLPTQKMGQYIRDHYTVTSVKQYTRSARSEKMDPAALNCIQSQADEIEKAFASGRLNHLAIALKGQPSMTFRQSIQWVRTNGFYVKLIDWRKAGPEVPYPEAPSISVAETGDVSEAGDDVYSGQTIRIRALVDVKNECHSLSADQLIERMQVAEFMSRKSIEKIARESAARAKEFGELLQ